MWYEDIVWRSSGRRLGGQAGPGVTYGCEIMLTAKAPASSSTATRRQFGRKGVCAHSHQAYYEVYKKRFMDSIYSCTNFSVTQPTSTRFYIHNGTLAILHPTFTPLTFTSRTSLVSHLHPCATFTHALILS